MIGLPAHWESTLPLPLSITGAIRFENQAQFDPLAFLQAIVPRLMIYENTLVHHIEPHQIYAGERRVCCKAIVVATHFPIRNTPGYYFMRMHQQRSYVLALTNAPPIDGMYIDMDPQGYSCLLYTSRCV